MNYCEKSKMQAMHIIMVSFLKQCSPELLLYFDHTHDLVIYTLYKYGEMIGSIYTRLHFQSLYVMCISKETSDLVCPGYLILFGREMNKLFLAKLIFSVTMITFYKCWNFKAVLDENLSKTYFLKYIFSFIKMHQKLNILMEDKSFIQLSQ